jgi:hypothetical protein
MNMASQAWTRKRELTIRRTQDATSWIPGPSVEYIQYQKNRVEDVQQTLESNEKKLHNDKESVHVSGRTANGMGAPNLPQAHWVLEACQHGHGEREEATNSTHRKPNMHRTVGSPTRTNRHSLFKESVTALCPGALKCLRQMAMKRVPDDRQTCVKFEDYGIRGKASPCCDALLCAMVT